MNMTSLRRWAGAVIGAFAIAAWAPPLEAQPLPDPTVGPRVQGSALPAFPPLATSGGEVVLELTIDAGGLVAEVQALRATPPFTEALTAAVTTWRFAPAIRLVDDRPSAAPGRVLVAAIIRPPTLYGGATAGTPPHPAGLPSTDVPELVGLTQPVYPPMARGSGTVLVEIEMNARAEPEAYRVLATTGGFEAAALDAVRTWRFNPPADGERPARMFAYAVIGFREPVAPR